MAISSRRDSSGGNADQKIGELLGLVSMLADNITQLRQDSTRQADKQDEVAVRLGLQIANIKEEQLRSITTMQTQVGSLVVQVEKLSEATRDIALIRDQVEKMRGPVEKLTGFMTRILAYATIIGAVFVVLWTIFQDPLKATLGSVFKATGH